MEHVCSIRLGLAEMGREQGLGLTAWLHAQTQLKAAVGTVLFVTSWGAPRFPTKLAFQLSQHPSEGGPMRGAGARWTEAG